MITGAKTLDIQATPDEVFARLADLPAYPTWQSFVTDVGIRDQDAAGRATVVEARLDAKATTLRAVLRYAFEPTSRVSWTYEDGDLKDMRGSFTLTPAGEDGSVTSVTMEVSVDPGFKLGLLLRGPVEARVKAAVLDGTLEGLARTFA